VNNDGGGIFSFLPQSSEEKYFEQVFGTPHGLDFSHLVALYGGTYVKARDWEHFEESLQRAIHSEGLNVIEVRTDRQENVMSHRRLWNYVSREILLSNHGETNENSC
jgi:2-succinyl-5-enolpyruvyl-6-hydroxy-3-cyclohexene-1-carboxylate synthase